MVKPAFTNSSVRLCDMSELFFLNYLEFVSSIQILSPRVYYGPWEYLSITSYGQYDSSGGFVARFPGMNNDWNFDNDIINFLFWTTEPIRPIYIYFIVHFMGSYQAITLLLISNSWDN